MTSPKRPPRILITNIVTLNTGDAAILQGMLQILRERYGSDAEIVVYDRAAAVASKYYPWATFRQAPLIKERRSLLDRCLSRVGYGHWSIRLRYAQLRIVMCLLRLKLGFLASLMASPATRAAIRDYLDADLVVSTGGTYLVENYDLAPAIYDYRLTLAAKRPLVFFTQSLGPFTRERHRRAFADIFQQAIAIFLRDERSREHLLDLGVDSGKITLARDAAFMLVKEHEADAARPASEHRPLRVAVSVRSLRFFGSEEREVAFVRGVRDLVSYLVTQQDAEVTFLSTCQGIAEYWTDDSKTASELVAGLPEAIQERVTVDGQFRQPAEIVEVYAGFDLVIATRMHAAILALAAGTPVFALAYEFKILELFGQLGLEKFAVPVEQVTRELGPAISTMLEARAQLRVRLAALQPQLKETASAVAEALPVRHGGELNGL